MLAHGSALLYALHDGGRRLLITAYAEIQVPVGVAHHTYPSELTPSLSALPRARLLVTMPVAPHLLNDEELAVLRTYGSEEVAAAQSVLFAAGEAAYDLIVVLEGHAQIAEDDWQQRVGATFGPSEFLGELDLLTGKRVSLTGKMLTDGRILRLPVAQLRRVMANELVLN